MSAVVRHRCRQRAAQRGCLDNRCLMPHPKPVFQGNALGLGDVGGVVHGHGALHHGLLLDGHRMLAHPI
jgi:hypothetical protein